jgi:hypothetical protein
MTGAMSKMTFTLELMLATEALPLATETPTPDDPRFDHVF